MTIPNGSEVVYITSNHEDGSSIVLQPWDRIQLLRSKLKDGKESWHEILDVLPLYYVDGNNRQEVFGFVLDKEQSSIVKSVQSPDKILLMVVGDFYPIKKSADIKRMNRSSAAASTRTSKSQ